MLETGHDPEDRGKMNDHVCFLIRHSRKILMPPVEIVHLVQKFYPEVVKNMPPPVRATSRRRQMVSFSDYVEFFLVLVHLFTVIINDFVPLVILGTPLSPYFMIF